MPAALSCFYNADSPKNEQKCPADVLPAPTGASTFPRTKKSRPIQSLPLPLSIQAAHRSIRITKAVPSALVIWFLGRTVPSS